MRSKGLLRRYFGFEDELCGGWYIGIGSLYSLLWYCYVVQNLYNFEGISKVVIHSIFEA